MSKELLRERRKQRQRWSKARSILIWGGLGAVLLVIVGILAWPALRPVLIPAKGEAVPVFSREHVEEGTDPGPYRTDPPAGGQHYASELDPGFYEADDMAGIGPYPEGYLVHNLEHGYVIFWYNCDLLDEAGCEELKGGIQGVMDEFDNFKVIAFPWGSTPTPVVLTSWGRILRMPEFNARQAADFVRDNQNRAPEPNAP
jgi:hypothetical protein